jgi:hypothetical protein
MRQVTVTADIPVTVGEVTTYTTVPVIIDQYQNPASVTYSKSGTGTVEVTTTDPYPKVNQDFVEADFVWVTAPTDYPNASGFLGQPFRAIRLSGSTANTSTLTVIQSGVKG